MLAQIIQNIFKKKRGENLSQEMDHQRPLVPQPASSAPMPSGNDYLDPETQRRALIPMVNEDEMGTGQMGEPTQPMTQPPLPVQPIVPQMSSRQQAEANLAKVQNKDYSAPTYITPQGMESKDRSIKGVPNEVLMPGGKDRDTDHNWWDSVKSGLLGAGVGFTKGGLGGALAGGVGGAIGGAVDRNFDEKMIDRNFRVPQLQAKVDAEREREMYGLGVQQKQAQIEQAEMQPVLRERQIELNAEIAQRRAELADRMQTWKETDRDRWFKWEEVKQKAKETNDTARIKIAEQRQAEIERNNKATEQGRNERAKAQIQSKEGIARDTRHFNAEQKAAERRLRVALDQYKIAKDHEKAYKLEEVRLARQAAKDAGIE